MSNVVIENKGNQGPKEWSRDIVSWADQGSQLSDVDRFDKHIDSIIYNIGSLGCLGLTPQQITAGILAVNSANKQKLSMPRDEHGKLLKGENFVGPEQALQEILDQRIINE